MIRTPNPMDDEEKACSPLLPSPSSSDSFVARNGFASLPTIVSNASDDQKSTPISQYCEAIRALEAPWHAIVVNCNTPDGNKPLGATSLFRDICQKIDGRPYTKKELETKVYDELINRLHSVEIELREYLRTSEIDQNVLPAAPKNYNELYFLLEGTSPKKKKHMQENDCLDGVDDNAFHEKKRSKKDPHNDKVYGRIVNTQYLDKRLIEYVKEKLKSTVRKNKAASLSVQSKLISPPSTASPRRHSGTTSSSLTDSTSPDESIRSSLPTEEPPVYSTVTLASLVAARRLEFEAFSQVPNMEDVCLDRLTRNHGALLAWMETAPMCIEIDYPWMTNPLNELLNRNLQRILARVRVNRRGNDPHDPDSSGQNGKDSDGAGPCPFYQDGRNAYPGDSPESPRANGGTNSNSTNHSGNFSHASLGKSPDVSSPAGNRPHSNDVDSMGLGENDSDDLPSSSSEEGKESCNKYQNFGNDADASTSSDDESSGEDDSDESDQGGGGPCSARSKRRRCDMEGKTIGDLDHLQNMPDPVVRSGKDPRRSSDAVLFTENLLNHQDSDCVYKRITIDEERDEMVRNYISTYHECHLLAMNRVRGEETNIMKPPAIPLQQDDSVEILGHWMSMEDDNNASDDKDGDSDYSSNVCGSDNGDGTYFSNEKDMYFVEFPENKLNEAKVESLHIDALSPASISKYSEVGSTIMEADRNISDALTESVQVPVIHWMDVEVGDLICSGTFSSVYKVSLPNHSFFPSSNISRYFRDSAPSRLERNEADVMPGVGVFNQFFALKRLNPITLDSSSSFQLGVREMSYEAKMLSQVLRSHHPNIVQLHGISSNFFADPKQGFIILEYLYETLDKKLLEIKNRLWKRIAFFSFGGPKVRDTSAPEYEQIYRTREYGSGIASALAHLHKHRILYRDLKPANIGFDAFGSIKLLDFGSSRLLDDDDVNSGKRLTPGVGSLRYMSPECSLGKHYGFPSDVHSFAILLWQIHTLRLPYGDIHSSSVMTERAFLGKERPSLRLVSSNPVKALLQRSWNHNPEERPCFRSIEDTLLSLESSNDTEKQHTSRSLKNVEGSATK